ncbi:hypothetical protein JVT61DRAFT_3029 [Boletus reticuloceps]|uniref:Uncharacterized protein n=1 Tax=Boletus reticuloceps TaxID=495285 RepID=A0A8I3AA96_9AGAM|nr:hypothetical protein JVT61DRAFT_3029 [Boletus reticuloceps]
MASTSKTLTNSAHEPGYTCVAFSRDGKLSYTGGSDSLVRIWQMDKDQYQEPEVAYEADEGITAIACTVRPLHRRLFPRKYDRDARDSRAYVASE